MNEPRKKKEERSLTRLRAVEGEEDDDDDDDDDDDRGRGDDLTVPSTVTVLPVSEFRISVTANALGWVGRWRCHGVTVKQITKDKRVKRQTKTEEIQR